MTVIGKILAACACFLASTVLAADTKTFGFKFTQAQQLQLAVVQMPLLDAVSTLAKTTGITVHYAGLANKPISKTCAEVSIKRLFECLLDNEADLVFRYEEGAVTDGKPWLAELWVWGFSPSDGQGGFGLGLAKPTPGERMPPDPRQQLLAGLDVNKLLADAKSQDPSIRTDALAALALLAQTHNPQVRKTLQSALSDGVPEVRAQAVFGLAHYDDAGALAGLESALQDDDVSVRLMVVDGADAHPALLQMALADSDENVRAYAANKLDSLVQGH